MISEVDYWIIKTALKYMENGFLTHDNKLGEVENMEEIIKDIEKTESNLQRYMFDSMKKNPILNDLK